MGFDVSGFAQSGSQSIDKLGQQMADLQNNAPDGQMSDEDMLTYQADIQKWGIMMNMQTSVQKSWSDAMNAVARNL